MTKGRRKKNFKGQTINQENLQALIKKQLAVNKTKKYTPKQLLKKLKVTNPETDIVKALDALIKKGKVVNLRDDIYKWESLGESENRRKSKLPKKQYVGRVDMTRSGAAYIMVDELHTDVYVPAKYTMGAMDKDTVKVEVAVDRRRKKLEGRVIEIVKRSITHVLGRLHVHKNYGIVIPELDRLFPEVLIHKDKLKPEYGGKRVTVKITEYHNNGQNSTFWGEVMRVLPETDSNDMAMQSILLSQGFELEFPPEVIEESEKIDGTITEQEIEKRRDFREILTFTIDPLTAKDFDDALSYRILENGDTEVGVHIADVTNYLIENSALDKEAYRRSTSVYLVDRVLPMLPEKLSNDLCSLNPHEDKLTFSAVFTFNTQYKITSRWFGKTIIHSDRRFTYEEAQEILEGNEGDCKEALLKLNDIALKLRKDRFKNGSINFESDEIRFQLDENNKPIGVYAKERKEANMLIEDFMLLANREVAFYMSKKAVPEIPFVYRIHDTPDMDRLADFALFAKALGFQMKLNNPKEIAESFNRLADEAEKNPLLKLLEPLAIRTMAKAEYSTDNIGHYGLAFEYYSHFTSPIRRYADVLAHRILYENLGKEIHRREKMPLELKCKHISSQEKKAADAERESIKYKQAEFLQDKVGEVFDAYVSGIIDRGFFVALTESRAEGMIPFDSLGESYKVADSRMKAIAYPSGHEITMGKKLKVKVLEVNLSARLIEFEVVSWD
ncbi:MAG TPA: ribonuclease R [Saprospiraceae bacterium]|nr:ribonuclease R [Saprospiraceae bacterium]